MNKTRVRRTLLCAGLASAACTGCFSSDNEPAAAAIDGSPSVPSDGGDLVDATTGRDGASESDAGSIDATLGADSSPGTDAGVVLTDAMSASDSGCGDGGPGTFSCTGGLNTPRSAPGGAGLANGNVLVAGGWNNTDNTLASAEIYDPTSGTFAKTGTMGGEHLWSGWAQPWPVLSSGKVLAAGGLSASGALLGSAELYDPAAAMFTGTGGLGTPVVSYGEVKLQDGSVLIVGGYSTVTGAPPAPSFMYTAGTNVAQRYDPTSGMFSGAGTLAEARLFGCNVVLPSGEVLAIGGWQGVPTTFESNIEQYDPVMIQWTTVGTLANGVTCDANAFNLPGGKVLLDTSQILDPDGLTTAATSNAPSLSNASFVQLANGDVLAFGGKVSGSLSTAAEVYRNATGQWTAVGSMHQARQGSRGFLMTSGDVLVVGGADENSNALTSAEIYHP
jgi:hypothetical protein